jgi:integrase
MCGVPMRAVQELMGHASIVITMRYAHLAPEVSRDAVNCSMYRATSLGLKLWQRIGKTSQAIV